MLNIEANKLLNIGSLTGLFLELNDNRLYELPQSIHKCTKLQTLKAKRNRLNSLPEGIGLLTNLIEIDIAFNNLVTLPEDITQLENLQKLDIRSDSSNLTSSTNR